MQATLVKQKQSTEIGYVLFEDIGINQRVYYSYHDTLPEAQKAQRKNRKTNIGLISKDEYNYMVGE